MKIDSQVFKERFMLFMNQPISEVKSQVHAKLRRASDRHQYETETKDQCADVVKAISARVLAEQAIRDKSDQEELARMHRCRSSFPPAKSDDVSDHPTVFIPEHPTSVVPPVSDVYLSHESATIRRMNSVRPQEPESKPLPSSIQVRPISEVGRYSIAGDLKPKERIETACSIGRINTRRR